MAPAARPYALALARRPLRLAEAEQQCVLDRRARFQRARVGREQRAETADQVGLFGPSMLAFALAPPELAGVAFTGPVAEAFGLRAALVLSGIGLLAGSLPYVLTPITRLRARWTT